MKSTNERLYEIFKTVFYDPKYDELAAQFRNRQEALFLLYREITNDQGQIIDDYIEVIWKVHEAMMRIAVEG